MRIQNTKYQILYFCLHMKIKHTLCQQWPNELLFLKCNTFDNKTELSINEVYTYFAEFWFQKLNKSQRTLFEFDNMSCSWLQSFIPLNQYLHFSTVAAPKLQLFNNESNFNIFYMAAFCSLFFLMSIIKINASVWTHWGTFV